MCNIGQIWVNLFMHNIWKWSKYFTTLAGWTPQDFWSIFGHFPTLCMNGLKITDQKVPGTCRYYAPGNIVYNNLITQNKYLFSCNNTKFQDILKKSNSESHIKYMREIQKIQEIQFSNFLEVAIFNRLVDEAWNHNRSTHTNI